MKIIFWSLLIVLYLGHSCLSDSSSSEEDDGNNFIPQETLLQNFKELAEDEQLTPEETLSLLGGEATLNTTDSSNSSSVDTKFFFWPFWGWGWGTLGCRLRICYALGAYAIFPVCGYDTNLGYRSFANICYLNATNTCFQTSYVYNRTGYC